ncbi:hypothetical protein AMS68_001514 [Peltaster fructicola]|uniref:NYN domain-containing protein n=1 Tax=Peltaster fructicola TaxID=286661 RepID=A0A6H0XMM4_9PEZI|nr:hypothetical protein AMS68_001514 [Peltaster fructicola]
MSTPQQNKPWDLSHVLDLVNALSSPSPTTQLDSNDYLTVKAAPITNNDRISGIDSKDFASKPAASLGDFGEIWHFLGTQPLVKAEIGPTVNSSTHPTDTFTSKSDYTSDGAVRYGSRTKGSKRVTWKEETSADEPDPESASERSHQSMLDVPKLTKSQRKKQNRRERKAKEASLGQGTVSESEADNVWSATPARKASTHAVPTQPARVYNLRPRHNSAIPSANGAAHESKENGLPAKHNGDVHITRAGSPLLARPEVGFRQRSQPLPASQQDDASHKWPVPIATASNSVNMFLPASVSPGNATSRNMSTMEPTFSDPAAKAVLAVQAAQTELQGIVNFNTIPQRQPAITPKIVRTGDDRHWALLLKLLHEFGEDRKHLVAPMNLTTHNNHDAGIHVFVDASNIFIGFNDQLKKSRGIPLTARVPPVSLSFDGLALLMERRRPVAKRVLAGSTPHIPAFDKAKAVGYECNILEKVYKARELTERQIYFRDVDRRHYGRAKAARSSHGSAGLPSTSPSNGYLSGTDDHNGTMSGSETTTAGPQYAPAKMIEQGVDEILHLKIAHSVMDYQKPATMVLATGDAAQAEYSDGFMAMVERALKQGWKVELVSWSKNISSMYLQTSFRQRWGDHFRVIFLDDYAEELLDM